ncbi:hypothetical protein [Saccharopolyspora sp. SCSIO 74807]|uniref:hypothetical protein n=1 Tax=Saccharopolyspora sp. SCSIO 74807 TaxID=3118084 RepID=UPI0030CAEA77
MTPARARRSGAARRFPRTGRFRPPPRMGECPQGGEHVLMPKQGGGMVCIKCNEEWGCDGEHDTGRHDPP